MLSWILLAGWELTGECGGLAPRDKEREKCALTCAKAEEEPSGIGDSKMF